MRRLNSFHLETEYSPKAGAWHTRVFANPQGRGYSVVCDKSGGSAPTDALNHAISVCFPVAYRATATEYARYMRPYYNKFNVMPKGREMSTRDALDSKDRAVGIRDSAMQACIRTTHVDLMDVFSSIDVALDEGGA